MAAHILAISKIIHCEQVKGCCLPFTVSEVLSSLPGTRTHLPTLSFLHYGDEVEASRRSLPFLDFHYKQHKMNGIPSLLQGRASALLKSRFIWVLLVKEGCHVLPNGRREKMEVFWLSSPYRCHAMKVREGEEGIENAQIKLAKLSSVPLLYKESKAVFKKFQASLG